MFFFIILGLASISFTGCHFFNLPVPEYLDRYSNEAGLHSVVFSKNTDVRSTQLADHIILPGAAESRLVFSLWNPKKFLLDIKIYRYDFEGSLWEGTPILLVEGLPSDIDSFSDAKGTFALEYNPSVNTDGFNLLIKDAKIDGKYRFRAEINERDGVERDFGSMETPLIHCNIKPVTPAIPLAPLTLTGSELFASWIVANCENLAAYKNAVSMKIDFKQIAKDGNIRYSTYTRTYTKKSESGNDIWKADNGISDDLPYFGSSGTFQALMPEAGENPTFMHSADARPFAQFRIILFNELGQSSDEAHTLGYYDSALNTLYVRGPGASDTNAGIDSLLPLASVEKALVLIAGMTNPKIVLMDDIGSGYTTSDTDPDRKDNYSLVSVKGFSGPKLTILGNNKKIDASWTGRRGLYINYNGILTIEGLTVENGSILGNGGGIYYTGSGELILGNGVQILNNIAADSGGGIYLDGSGTCRVLDGTIISENAASGAGNGKGGGGIYLKSGTLRMSGGTIGTSTIGNTASREGGGVHVNGDNALFEMNGGEIVLNKAEASGDGGGVFVGRGTFNLSGSGIIRSNNAGISGGGVHVREYGRFNMSGGTITRNTAGSANYGGGGVAVADGKLINANAGYGARFTMSGGTISFNHTTHITGCGGGVIVYAANECRAEFTLGGTAIISDNWTRYNSNTNEKSYGGGVHLGGDGSGSAKMLLSGNALIANNGQEEGGTAKTNAGGGISVLSNGELTMNGGTIEANNAHADGGGLYISNGKAVMQGGYIGTLGKANTADFGGGVHIAAGWGTFEMNGNSGTPVIQYNIAYPDNDIGGGGVFMHADATFTMKGGIIRHNKDATLHKGVRVYGAYAKFSMQGSARVDQDNMVDLTDGNRITLSGPFTGSDPIAKILPRNPAPGLSVIDASGLSGGMTQALAGRFTLGVAGYSLALDGTLKADGP